MNINKINGYKEIMNLSNDIKTDLDKGNNFKNILQSALQDVNNLQLQSEYQKEKLVIGELDNLHDLTIAAEKANVALQVTMSIRNKMVEAYREIMRIQI